MIETGKTSYVQGTAARKLEQPKTEYNVYEENKVLREKKQYKNNSKAKANIVFTVMLAFACGLTLIYRYALITEMNYKLQKANYQYAQLRNENSRLKVDIEKKLDLQTVKETAEKRLGMQKPDKYQVTRINVPKTDFTSVADEYKNVNAMKSNSVLQVLDRIKKFTDLLY